MENTFYSTTETARILGITRQAVGYLARKKILRPIEGVKAARARLFSEEEIQRFLADRIR